MAKEEGVNLPKEDLDDKPEERVNAKSINAEANEKKRGGRAKRRHGGEVHSAVKRHSMMHNAARKRGGRLDGKKMVEVHGEHEKRRADRKPRKDGGRTGSDQAPFSSARHGTDPTDHKTEMEYS